MSGWEVEFLAHVPCSRDHHGLLPDPGGEGHARLLSGRESWFFVGKFCRLFASPSEPIAQVLSLLPFLSSPWLQLVGFSAFPIVRTCVSRFAAVFVVGRDARILVLTFDGGTCCCFAHSHYCKKNKLKWRCWCKSMREEWEPAKVLIHCQSL